LNAQPAARAPARPAVRAPWWQGLRLWQGLSALAVAASLLLSALLLVRTPEPAGARYVALLQSPDNQTTGWVVELQAGGKLRLVPTAAATAPPPGRALQFWTKAEGAAGPTSLGLVQAGQTIELPVARLPAVEARQLFEITLEPEGGSTVGRPTGPILFVGRTVAL
jgi:anti-sigma-K factor RskA